MHPFSLYLELGSYFLIVMENCVNGCYRESVSISRPIGISVPPLGRSTCFISSAEKSILAQISEHLVMPTTYESAGVIGVG